LALTITLEKNVELRFSTIDLEIDDIPEWVTVDS
jgi:hypothetical protein